MDHIKYIWNPSEQHVIESYVIGTLCIYTRLQVQNMSCATLPNKLVLKSCTNTCIHKPKTITCCIIISLAMCLIMWIYLQKRKQKKFGNIHKGGHGYVASLSIGGPKMDIPLRLFPSQGSIQNFQFFVPLFWTLSLH